MAPTANRKGNSKVLLLIFPLIYLHSNSHQGLKQPSQFPNKTIKITRQPCRFTFLLCRCAITKVKVVYLRVILKN